MKKYTLEEAKAYNKGWQDAMVVARDIALSINSNRGNEKLIVKAIEDRKDLGV